MMESKLEYGSLTHSTSEPWDYRVHSAYDEYIANGSCTAMLVRAAYISSLVVVPVPVPFV